MYFVYILKCRENYIYTGCTQNIKERMQRHKNGHVPATKNQRPIKLICCVIFPDKYQAYAFEKYLKTGSGRAFSQKHLYK
ncbi:MAG: GIY-YIG nuclease family protein [Patescibacteria group bacterium]